MQYLVKMIKAFMLAMIALVMGMSAAYAGNQAGSASSGSQAASAKEANSHSMADKARMNSASNQSNSYSMNQGSNSMNQGSSMNQGNSMSQSGAMAQKPKMSEFCWNELATNNVQAAKDFYGKVFGWKFTEHPMGDMTYTMAKINDKDFAGIWAIPKDQASQIQPHWMAYIMVENLEQALNKATQNGATVLKPATQAGEYGRLAIIKDPTGAAIALWQPLKDMNKNQNNQNQ